jgi:hypothetical protein
VQAEESKLLLNICFLSEISKPHPVPHKQKHTTDWQSLAKFGKSPERVFVAQARGRQALNHIVQCNKSGKLHQNGAEPRGRGGVLLTGLRLLKFNDLRILSFVGCACFSPWQRLIAQCCTAI